ncbi:MAG TPA: hypothetical protein DCP91_03405 [Eggerthellaceae bacterium]|nr:hypothetical protein [Eggerthellaceae bacterium]
MRHGCADGRILFVGGGTCAGKTTLAASLARIIGARTFSVDDRLGDYAQAAARDGSEAAIAGGSDDFERMWMRDPAKQFDEMLRFYRDVFPYVMNDVESVLGQAVSGVCANGEPRFALIAEGVAFLPELLHAAGVPASSCVFLTADRDVHDERYALREWAPLMLEGCTDPDSAFAQWMDRDELLSQHVRSQCTHLGYAHIHVSSHDTPDDIVRRAQSCCFPTPIDN